MAVSSISRGGLFLDRDGVVNFDNGYAHRPDQIEFLPGIFDLGRTAMRLNLPIMIVTNQSGVARGLYSQQQFHDLMIWMREVFANERIVIAHVEHCPWYPPSAAPSRDIQADWVRDSWWHKPGAGMLRRAAQAVGVDPANAVIIGDRVGDVEAGREAGVRATIQFGPGEPDPADYGADYHCYAHHEVIEILNDLYG